jgi:hypothetical protein
MDTAAVILNAPAVAYAAHTVPYMCVYVCVPAVAYAAHTIPYMCVYVCAGSCLRRTHHPVHVCVCVCAGSCLRRTHAGRYLRRTHAGRYFVGTLSPAGWVAVYLSKVERERRGKRESGQRGDSGDTERGGEGQGGSGGHARLTLPVCPYARMPACPHARMPVCPYARMPVCLNADMYTRAHVLVFTAVRCEVGYLSRTHCQALTESRDSLHSEERSTTCQGLTRVIYVRDSFRCALTNACSFVFMHDQVHVPFRHAPRPMSRISGGGRSRTHKVHTQSTHTQASDALVRRCPSCVPVCACVCARMCVHV